MTPVASTRSSPRASSPAVGAPARSCGCMLIAVAVPEKAPGPAILPRGAAGRPPGPRAPAAGRAVVVVGSAGRGLRRRVRVGVATEQELGAVDGAGPVSAPGGAAVGARRQDAEHLQER